jgi:uncharacterized protein YdhG (YjbR/CyaY superfamily)
MRKIARRSRPKTIDAYLAAVGTEQRAALERLRRTIRRIVPDAEECISYGIPAFRWGGAVFAGFMVRKQGCSYFPFSGSTLQTISRDLGAYGRTKSALHFSPAKPLPVTLVRRLVRARIAEIRSR